MTLRVLILIFALALVGCDHVIHRTGGTSLSIEPVCEDTGKPPKEFVLEIGVLETGWATVGGGRSDAESWQEANPHISTLSATIHEQVVVYRVPVYAYAEERRLPWQDRLRVGQIRMRIVSASVYSDGCEMASLPLGRTPEEKPLPSRQVLRLKPFDTSSHEFSLLWSSLQDTSTVGFPGKMAAWQKASRDPKQRTAIERIYQWYIARYEAAVRDKPELLKEPNAARHIAMLRERLAKMTAKNSNSGK